jgi:hypothetical protein
MHTVKKFVKYEASFKNGIKKGGSPILMLTAEWVPRTVHNNIVTDKKDGPEC